MNLRKDHYHTDPRSFHFLYARKGCPAKLSRRGGDCGPYRASTRCCSFDDQWRGLVWALPTAWCRSWGSPMNPVHDGFGIDRRARCGGYWALAPLHTQMNCISPERYRQVMRSWWLSKLSFSTVRPQIVDKKLQLSATDV